MSEEINGSGIERGVWHTSRRFEELLDPMKLKIKNTDWFNDPRLKWMHDAWVASTFAKRSQAVRVLLRVDGDWPDFEVEFQDGTQLPCECTIALFPGREIGKEYREWERSGNKVQHVTQAEIEARRSALGPSLRAAVATKLAKKYPRGAAALVIYENVGGFHRDDDDVEPELVENTKEAFGAFNSVWVLSNRKLYRTWPRGLVLSG